MILVEFKELDIEKLEKKCLTRISNHLGGDFMNVRDGVEYMMHAALTQYNNGNNENSITITVSNLCIS